MDFDVLGFRLLGDKDVGEDDGDDEENDDDDQAFTQIAFGLTHPFNASELLFLGATHFAFRVMMASHGYFRME